jgi:GTP cyclohydrolase I
VAKALQERFGGYKMNPADVLKVFEDGAERCDQMVVVSSIPVYSKCEHHLEDIFGVAHIGYIPDGKVVGLSKLARVCEIFARRAQVQERLTNQIADALQDNLNPKGVGVVLECRHMCMEARGVRTPGTTTTTSALRGDMLTDAATRAEFLSLVRTRPRSDIL